MKLMCLFMFCILIIGCGIRVPLLLCRDFVPQKVETFTNYKPGEVYTVTTGSDMLVIESRYVTPCFKTLFDYEPPLIELPGVSGTQSVEMPELSERNRWLAVKTPISMSGYVIASSFYSSDFGIHITPAGEVSSGWVKLSDRRIPCQVEWTKKQLFEKVEDLAGELNFKVELLYLGISQNTVRLLYREFTGELIARQAFYCDLTYDMSGSKKIVFKTIEMEVIEATNSNITFQVITDGGLPWIPYPLG